jgi:hypothetical protein
MKVRLDPPFSRRDVLRAMSVGAVANTPLALAEGAASRNTAKGRARYQPNSPDVQAFYRVNRFPAK